MNQADNWRPTAAPEQLKARARLLKDIRDYFFAREVMEVETPLISSAGNTDPQIESIRTHTGAYLRTSPEFALKRLLASGSGDIFELGRVFRDGESGRYHNPEFTMLEWYRTAFSYHRLMDEIAGLVKHCGNGKFDSWTEQKLSYKQLFLKYLNLDPFTADSTNLAATAKLHGISDIKLNRDQWLDLLLSHVIQPALPDQCLTFVFDYPVNQSALAKIRPGSPPVAERFELYLEQNELANGYQELTDAKEQQERFAAENVAREDNRQVIYDVDYRLIKALEHGLPECAGVALGVDRLLMAVTGCESIREVTAFPGLNA